MQLNTRNSFFFIIATVTLILTYQSCGPAFKSSSADSLMSLSSPNVMGSLLYSKNCMGCHGPLQNSAKQNRGFEEIKNALSHIPQMSAIQLSDIEINAISQALQNSKCQSTGEVERSPLQRITHTEFQNSIIDYFGLSRNYIANFQADPLTNGFSRNANVLTVSDLLTEDYYSASIQVATDLLSNRRAFIFTCTSGVACARNIYSRIASSLFRKPISTNADPVEQLIQRVYTPSINQGETFESAVLLGVRALLMSPEFLYHDYAIAGSPEDTTRIAALSDYELAERLASFLWSSLPDANLTQLASQGQLKNQLDSEVRRMLTDPKANSLVDEFFYEWLKLSHFEGVSPDATIYSNFSQQVYQDMKTETQLFLQDILGNDLSLYNFVDAKYTFLNQNLANFYGVQGLTGNQFQKTILSSQQRIGVITQGSILTMNSKADRSNVIARGFWLLENILCDEPPPPPQDLNIIPPSSVVESDLRLTLEAHRNSAACYSCHSVMDPLGFGLENFDGIGVWRNQYLDGKPIDNLGKLPSGKTFNGPIELVKVVESENRFGFCASKQMMTYALSRVPASDETCRAYENGNSSVQAKGPLSETILNVIKDPSFLNKRGGSQ